MRNAFLISLVASLFSFLPVRAAAELSPIEQMVSTLSQPETQQKLLNLIFPGQVDSAASAIQDPKTRVYLFRKRNDWVQLGSNVVFSTAAVPGPYLIASAMLYKAPDREPDSAASYLFYDLNQKPMLISPGYATREEIQEVYLPQLGKTFLLMIDASSPRKGATVQWSLFVMQMRSVGPTEPLRTVWSSPPFARNFQVGFDNLGGSQEHLVMRIKPSSGDGDIQYKAYSWNGTRFEPEDFFESRMKALPSSVWAYGAP